MAGDWIKIEEAMPDKPEVFAIAAELNLDPDAVVGKLIRVWAWASRSCHADGTATASSKHAIDRAAGTSGFAKAMLLCGWLLEKGDKLQFPNFDRHNSKTAKERGLAFIRKQRHRAKKDGTVLERSRHANRVTKETETEKNIRDTASAVSQGKSTRFVPPTLEQVRDYCRERANGVDPQKFIDHYTANGWRVGKNAMKDWQASVRTWERNEQERARGRPPSVRPSVAEHNAAVAREVFGRDQDYDHDEPEAEADGTAAGNHPLLHGPDDSP